MVVGDEELARIPQDLRTWQRLRGLSIGYAVLSILALAVARIRAPHAAVQSGFLVAGSVLCLGLSLTLLVLTTRMQRELREQFRELEREGAAAGLVLRVDRGAAVKRGPGSPAPPQAWRDRE